MKNVLTVVDCFVHNDRVRNKLNNCITKLKERDHDILLISNTKIDQEIQSKVDFFLYDCRNQLFKETYTNYITTDFWNHFNNFIVHDFVPGMQRHGLSVLINLFNSILFGYTLGYEYFQRFEVDDLMGPKSLDWVDQVPKLCSDNNQFGLFYFNERSNPKESDVSFHYFYCKISYFLEKIPRIQSEKDYQNFLTSYQGNMDFVIVERYLYENFRSRDSSKLIKRNGIDDITKDFSDTIWNSETTPSNVDSKYDGCVTKLYRRFVKGKEESGYILFSYNYVPLEKNRMILVLDKNGFPVDTINHSLSGANQWYYHVFPEKGYKIHVFEGKTFLYEESIDNVVSYIDFL